MRRKKVPLRSWAPKMMLFVVYLLCHGLGVITVTGEEGSKPIPIQVKIGDTANLTWYYGKHFVNSNKGTLKVGRSEDGIVLSLVMAGKFGNQEPSISTQLSEAERARILFEVNSKAATASFYLKNIQKEDENKIYGIEMEFGGSLIKEMKIINIVEPPKFVSKSSNLLEVKEGDTVTLSCEANGKPTPEIQWIAKESTKVLASGLGRKSFDFTANKTHHGAFECLASNVAGKISHTTSLIVNYAPTIDIAKSSATLYSFVDNPNPVTMKCFADGRPKPEYYWQSNFGLNVSKESTYTLVKPASAELGVSYKCFAWNKVGRSRPHSVKVVKLERPGMVDAKITKVTAKTISVQWALPNDTGGATLVGVRLLATGPAGFLKELNFGPEVTNTTLQNLQPFSEYGFEFIAKNQVLESLPFRVKGKTAEAAPSVPVKFGFADIDPNTERQLTVFWSPPLSSNGVIRNYQVAYGSESGFDVTKATIKNTTSNVTEMVLTGLMPFHTYSARVRAVTVEPGPWTKVLTKRTAYEAPSAPRNLTVLEISAKLIRLTWQPPKDVNGMVSTSEADFEYKELGKWHKRNELFVKNPQLRSREVEVLPFTEYRLRVREATGLARKWGPFSETYSFITPEGVPSVPKDVKITHRTVSSISLSWQRPERSNGIMTHFMVFYENSTRRYEEKVDYHLANDTFSHQILNLQLSTKYTLMIQAFTAAGGGERSDPIETETIDPVSVPRQRTDDEISAGPIIGGIFSFLVILVLLIILILFIARKQRIQKKANNSVTEPFDASPSPERRLLSPYDEKVPDLVSTNGKTPLLKQNSIDEKKSQGPTFISSRTIKIVELKDVCGQLHASKDSGFVQEFRSVKCEASLTSDISDRAENKCKNRYHNIVAYDHSRVILSYIENIPGSDYINANYIDGFDKRKKFIATQGPVTASFNDFWRMVWEQNSHIIVMVTNLIEKCRIKCQRYWPTYDSEQYGSIRVTREEEIELADYVIRKFSISMLSGKQKHEPRIVTQYQYTGWPDHGVPQYATGLLQFVKRIKASVREDSGPVIAHCSAGVGRTGTYITLDAMLDQMNKEQIVDVHGFVTHIRTQRNYMVQTEGQYAFIYDALLEAVICGNTEIAVRDLPIRIKELEKYNADTNKTFLHEEFERLSYNLEENHIYEAGMQEVNASKNRFPEIIPIESTRLRLWPYPNVAGSDYINANIMDGYQHREAFILTQAPMENTVEDFWRMVWEYEVFSIVMLSSPEESDSSHCFPYWPIDSEPANIGLLLVQIAAEERKSGYVKRDFRVTNSKSGETRIITHFMFYDWPFDSCPKDSVETLELINQLQKTQMMTGNGSIAVHCSDGCGRSGTLCAIMFCIERLKLEGVVDVFQTVRLMRTQRPHVIRSMENYLFCYKAIKNFIDKFSNYENFK